MSGIHPFGQHIWTRIIFWKTMGLTHFLSRWTQNSPFSRP